MALNSTGRPQGGGQYSGGRPQGGYQGGARPQPLPEGYLQGGYFKEEDGKPVLRREYILGYPGKIASLLTDQSNWGNRDKNKSTQLRKFYDYCIRVRDLLGREGTFAAVEGEFVRLVSFADYAEQRKRVTPLFVEFITRNVEAVGTRDDFYAFLKHFEAVIAHIKQ